MMVESPFGSGFLDPPAHTFGGAPSRTVQPGRLRSSGVVAVAQAIALTVIFSPVAAGDTVSSAMWIDEAAFDSLEPVIAVTGAESAHGVASAPETPSQVQPLTEWTESALEALAKSAPTEFLTLLASGQVQPTVLTYAAEHAGRLHEHGDTLAVLSLLLEHPKSYVREGALLGLAKLGTPAAWAQIRSAAQHDASATVRGIALELADFAGV